jgi:hypothetical protein
MDTDVEVPSTALALPMPPQPHPYLAQMARFCDGPLHAYRRAEVLRVLPDPPDLERGAQRLTETRLADRLDVVPLAFSVPVAVLGDALGVGDLNPEIADLTERGIVRTGLPDVARTSVLFQARDATAALVLTAIAEGRPHEAVAPVTRTRRAPDSWVSLVDAPYGAGPHECPGRAHALALARGMLAALGGFAVVERGPVVQWPNMSFVGRLVLERR